MISKVIFFFGGGWKGGGSLFEGGHLLTCPAYRVGGYLRWLLIQGWLLTGD